MKRPILKAKAMAKLCLVRLSHKKSSKTASTQESSPANLFSNLKLSGKKLATKIPTPIIGITLHKVTQQGTTDGLRIK
jgi:hypothetical protein